MGQTLLAVLALALALLLSLTMTRSRMAAEGTAATEQAGIHALDGGLELLDRIRALPFDAATAGLDPDAPLADRDALTALPFATGGTFATAADVDDVHGMQPETLDVGGIAMQATASVRYVNEDALTTASPTPTYAKEVTVFVWSAGIPDTLRLTQVVTYP